MASTYYGAWNRLKSQFQYGIKEKTKKAAEETLSRKLRKLNQRENFEIRRLPACLE